MRVHSRAPDMPKKGCNLFLTSTVPEANRKQLKPVAFLSIMTSAMSKKS